MKNHRFALIRPPSSAVGRSYTLALHGDYTFDELLAGSTTGLLIFSVSHCGGDELPETRVAMSLEQLAAAWRPESD